MSMIPNYQEISVSLLYSPREELNFNISSSAMPPNKSKSYQNTIGWPILDGGDEMVA